MKNGSNWIVCCGDARTVLPELADETVDCVVTSPPYYWLRDYNVEKQIGLEDTVGDYVSVINNVMEEVFRILRKTGLLSGPRYRGTGKRLSILSLHEVPYPDRLRQDFAPYGIRCQA